MYRTQPTERGIIETAERLIGQKVSTNKNGYAGREIEDLLESYGIPINRGIGPDILALGVEIKTRKIDATSAHTIFKMSEKKIVNTADYKETLIHAKFKKQLRIKINENDIVCDVGLYNFEKPQIEELMSKSYAHARNQLIQDPSLNYTPAAGQWAYFERTTGSDVLDFRVSDRDMRVLESMALSTFNNMFEFV